MKKITIITACMALAQTMQAGVPVPYSTPIADDSAWKIINVVEDSNAWEVKTTSDETGYDTDKVMKYNWDTRHAADDWLISPAVSLEGGKEYKVKIRCNIHKQEIVKIFMAIHDTPDVLKAGKILFDKADGDTDYDKWNTQIFIVTPEESGDWYFGIWEGSDINKYSSQVTGFEVLENVFAPGKVAGLTAVPDAGKAMEVFVSWMLPAVDSDGLPLSEGYSIDNVYVYRDGSEEPIATLDGTATSWTDTESTGLTGGYHSYEVAVKVNGAMSVKEQTQCGFVGPIAAAPLPWDPDIKTMSKEDFDLFFTTGKAAGSEATGKWEFKESSWSGNNIQFYPKGKADDWLITPPLKSDKAGIYRFRINAKGNDSNPTQTEIHIGTDTDSSGYNDTSKAATLSFRSTQADHFVYFMIDEPTTFHIAIRETWPDPGYSLENIYGMGVEEWYETPLPVTGLAAAVDGETVTLSWTNPTLSNTGQNLSGNLSEIKIYRGNEETPAITVTDAAKLIPGATVSVSDIPGLTGVVSYKVVPWLGERASEGEQATVCSPWIGDETQELPYKCDFKDASLHGLWRTANINGDTDEWQVTTIGAKLNIDKGSAQPEDVLMTPPFDLKAGYYKVTLRIGLPIKNYPFKVGVVKADDTASPALIGTETVLLNGYSYSSGYEVRIHITEGDKYRFAFLADSNGAEDKDNTLKIESVEISYLPVTPGLATDIKIVPDPDFRLKATLNWKNPSTSNIAGIEPVITSAKIFRKGELLAEITEGLLPGEISTYVDETVPEAGEYNYRIEIFGPEGNNGSERNVRSPWIGGGLSIENGYYPQTFSQWTAHNVNGDTDWDDYDITWETRTSSDAAEISSSKIADDWLISPRLNFVKDNLYEISLRSYNYSGQTSPVEWDLYAGTSTAYTDMTHKIATIITDDSETLAAVQSFRLVAVDPSGSDVVTTAGNDTPAAETVKVPAGITTIGFHHRTKGSFKVDSFQILKPVSTGITEMEVGEGTLPPDASDILVLDMTGRVIASFPDADGYNTATFDKGLYVVRFTVCGTRRSAKTMR